MHIFLLFHYVVGFVGPFRIWFRYTFLSFIIFPHHFVVMLAYFTTYFRD